jgi:sarcosine oxidase subunit beta
VRSDSWDIAVVGGGIMGCATALRLAEAGMRPVVLEQGEIGSGASGVNAGTLSLQIKRVKLMPYALRGRDLWEQAGAAVGFQRCGGLTLAFTQAEAALLEERARLKRAAGAPIEMVTPAWVAQREPALGRGIVAASWCAADGHASSSQTGAHYRRQLRAAGITWRERAPVTAIAREPAGFSLRAGGAEVRSRRLLLACGGWLAAAGRLLGLELPVRARINTVSVTERGPRLLDSVIVHATGLLTLKQKDNGTVLIGGGWQGRGHPDGGPGEVDLDTLLTNLRLARHALPALGGLRLVRSWTGFEAHTPDYFPLAGPLPGITDAWVLGCVRGGYTIGPYLGRLMGDLILGLKPELPLFDPARFSTEKGAAA